MLSEEVLAGEVAGSCGAGRTCQADLSANKDRAAYKVWIVGKRVVWGDVIVIDNGPALIASYRCIWL